MAATTESTLKLPVAPSDAGRPLNAGTLLDIRGLSISFASPKGPIGIVDEISLVVPRGKTVALVGESGCGKSVTALSILQLLHRDRAIVTGEVLFREPAGGSIDLAALNESDIRRFRGGKVAMVFQEPMTSLNPVLSIGEQIVETIVLHQRALCKTARGEAIRLLQRVGIPDASRRLRAYPHQFSGGMRQRVMIAMALSGKPSLLIADEPTTALDPTVQRQILDLLRELQAETGMSILLITHDLGVVAEFADEAYVMYAGRIVEHAAVAELFTRPLHPYTQGLLRAHPRLTAVREPLQAIPGRVPDPRSRPSGCRFHPRCELSMQHARTGNRPRIELDTDVETPFPQDAVVVLERCVRESSDEPAGVPPLREAAPGHHVACWESA